MKTAPEQPYVKRMAQNTDVRNRVKETEIKIKVEPCNYAPLTV